MLTAIAAIFVFLLVVVIHEGGHFAVAKLVGIRVNEFSIGMGPKLLQKIKGETTYTLRIFPIGGYVKMEGEDEDSEDPRGFSKVSVWSRIAVVSAGAIMNFILAIVVLSIVAFSFGNPTTTIKEIIEDYPAMQYGMLPGDKIVSIDDVEINNWNQIVETVNSTQTTTILNINVLRQGENILLKIKPILDDERVVIGIVPESEKSFLKAVEAGFNNTWYFLKVMFNFIVMTFQGQVTTDDLAGPVGVINIIGTQAKMGFINLLNILGFISVNLGFFNLLPIPALDGSRIAFLLVEAIRGKPVDPKKEGFVHFLGFIFLISLMLLVTYKDLIRINLF